MPRLEPRQDLFAEEQVTKVQVKKRQDRDRTRGPSRQILSDLTQVNLKHLCVRDEHATTFKGQAQTCTKCLQKLSSNSIRLIRETEKVINV